MSKKILTILLAVVLVVSLIAACAPQQRPTPRLRPAPQRAPMTPAPQAPPNMTPDRDQNEDVRRARLIADRVEDIDGIRAATVIVSGTTAYVGVDLSANAEGKLTNELKNTVVNTAKKTDKTLSRVYVSADVDTVARLRNYARDIERGRPMSGFVNEINEMFRRPAPTVR